MEQLENNGIYRIPTPTPFPVGAANIYLYKGERLTLFDAGTKTEAAWGVFTCRLQELGIALKDIEQIILTHHHLDHLGLSYRIKQESDAVIYAHPEVCREIPYMFDDAAMRRNAAIVLTELGVPDETAQKVVALRAFHKELLDPFVVDEDVADHATIGEFSVHFRPGHSITDTVFMHEKDRWAVTGDHLIRGVTPNPLLRRPDENGVRVKTLVEYCDALQKTRALEAEWCLPGHGAPFSDHLAVVDSTFAHIERRNNRILQLTTAEGATPYEITCRLFRNLSDVQLYYCLCAATSQMELLETNGMVTCANRDGVRYYSPSTL